MAVPPPPPPPDPPSSDTLPHTSSFPSSKPQSLPSDLVRSGPNRAALSSSAGQSSSGHAVLRQSPCQPASAPLAAAGSSSGISAQPLHIFPAIRASDLAAAGTDLAAAGPSSGHWSTAQALPLQPSRQPASSSPSPPNSDLPLPQTASVLPLLASVLQPPATSFTIPSSSSLPPPSQTASAAAQNPASIGSTPGVRFNASTKQSSDNPSSLPPPPHPPSSLSYVQAARHPRGSGFVRTHAADVESFARLPRTGANIICGSIEGIPSFSIVNSDLHTVENLFSNALMMKFHGGRPSLEVSHREIQSWGLEHPFSIGPLSSRAFLLRFQDNQDLIRVLTRPSSILITFPYKVFRWHNLCHLKDDSCYAPVWISLPRLPLQCFIPEFLESVANRIGRFLCFDRATTTLARPSAARLCVELDLRVSPPPFIWVGLFDGLKQPIIYEKLPKYCGECHIQGHLATTCPKGLRETSNIQASPRSLMDRARPPPARQNAVKRSSALLHQPNTPAAPSSNLHPPPPPNHLSTSAPTPSHLLNADAAQPLAAAYTTVPSPSLLLDADAARQHPQHTPSHQPIHLQVQPSASLLQWAPDAATPSYDPSQALPTAALLQSPPAAAGPSDALFLTQSTTALPQQHSAAAGPSDAQPQPSPALLQRTFPAAAPSTGSEPLLQSASPVQRVSVSAASPSPSPAPSASHASDLMVPSMTHPPSPHKSKSLKGKHKSIKTKPPDVGISTSLTQQQQAAIEQFKSKVLGHSRIRDNQPSSPTSVNHFEVLRYDHSDADDDLASYYSDTDDGCVEPTEMGYQSANGHSSNKHKDFATSGMRINKRHPNTPLRVKLRSRKNPSTP